LTSTIYPRRDRLRTSAEQYWSAELLERVVRENSKQRFEFSPDGRFIRARQGHSVDVDLGWDIREPPAMLYHGTVGNALEAITHEGLRPMSRHDVHLSEDASSAREVGGRRGKPVVLVVDAAAMHDEGIEFRRTDNGVWLVERVPPKYLSELAD
jgi:putative RNA 2'-phosphotransferase